MSCPWRLVVTCFYFLLLLVFSGWYAWVMGSGIFFFFTYYSVIPVNKYMKSASTQIKYKQVGSDVKT